MTKMELRTRNAGIFTAYNAARKLTKTGALDTGRLNRGFSLALRGDHEHLEKYATTVDGCGCPDQVYRDVVCKHIACEALKKLAAQL